MRNKPDTAVSGAARTCSGEFKYRLYDSRPRVSRTRSVFDGGVLYLWVLMYCCVRGRLSAREEVYAGVTRVFTLRLYLFRVVYFFVYY